MTAVVGIRADTQQADRDLQKINQSLQSIQKSTASVTSGLVTMAKGLAIFGTGAFLLNYLKNTTDEFVNLENRIKLTTDSIVELSRVQSQLIAMTLRTRSTIEGTSTVYYKLSDAVKSIGASQADIFKVTESINQAIAVSGSSAEAAKAAIIQLGQGLGSGVLRGEELNSVLEQTPRLAKAIADGMGVSLNQLRTLGAEGKLVSEAVFGAILSQTGKINAEFSKFVPTMVQGAQALGLSIKVLTNEMDRGFGLSSRIGVAFDREAKFIFRLAENLRESISVFKLDASQIITNTKELGKPLLDVFVAVGKQIAQVIPEFFITRTLMKDAKGAARALDDFFGNAFSDFGKDIIFGFEDMFQNTSDIEKAIIRIKRISATFFTGGFDVDTLKRFFTRDILVQYADAFKELAKAITANMDIMKVQVRGFFRSFNSGVQSTLRYLGFFQSSFLGFKFGNLDAFSVSLFQSIRGITGLHDTIFSVGDDFFRFMLDPLEQVQFTIILIGQAIKDMFRALRDNGLSGVGDALGGFIGTIREAIYSQAGIDNFLQAIKDIGASSALVTSVLGVFSNVVGALRAIGREAVLGSRPIARLAKEFTEHFVRIQFLTNHLHADFALLKQDLVLLFTDGFTMENFKNAVLDLSSVLKTAAQNVYEFAEKVIGYFFKIWDEVIAHSWWTDTIEAVIQTSADLWSNVADGLNRFKNNTIKVFQDVFTITNTGINNLGDALPKVTDKIGGILGDKLSGITDILGNYLESNNIKFSLDLSFKDNFKGVGELLGSLYRDLKENFPEIIRLALLSIGAFAISILFPESGTAKWITRILVASISAAALILADSFGTNLFGVSFLNQSGRALGEAAGQFAIAFIGHIPKIVSVLLAAVGGFVLGFIEQIPVIGSLFKVTFQAIGEDIGNLFGVILAAFATKSVFKLLQQLGLLGKTAEKIGKIFGKLEAVIASLKIGEFLLKTVGKTGILAGITLLLSFFGALDSLFFDSPVLKSLTQVGLVYLMIAGSKGLGRVKNYLSLIYMSYMTWLAKMRGVPGVNPLSFIGASGKSGGNTPFKFGDIFHFNPSNRATAAKAASEAINSVLDKIFASIYKAVTVTGSILSMLLLGNNPRSTARAAYNQFVKFFQPFQDILDKVFKGGGGAGLFAGIAAMMTRVKSVFSSTMATISKVLMTGVGAVSAYFGPGGLIGRLFLGKNAKFFIIGTVLAILTLFATSAEAATGKFAGMASTLGSIRDIIAGVIIGVTSLAGGLGSILVYVASLVAGLFGLNAALFILKSIGLKNLSWVQHLSTFAKKGTDAFMIMGAAIGQLGGIFSSVFGKGGKVDSAMSKSRDLMVVPQPGPTLLTQGPDGVYGVPDDKKSDSKKGGMFNKIFWGSLGVGGALTAVTGFFGDVGEVVSGFFEHLDVILLGYFGLQTFAPAVLAGITGALGKVGTVLLAFGATLAAKILAVVGVLGIIGIAIFGEGETFWQKLDDVLFRIQKRMGLVKDEMKSIQELSLDKKLDPANRFFIEKNAPSDLVGNKLFDTSQIDFRSADKSRIENLNKLMERTNDIAEKARLEQIQDGVVSADKMEDLITAIEATNKAIIRAAGASEITLFKNLDTLRDSFTQNREPVTALGRWLQALNDIPERIQMGVLTGVKVGSGFIAKAVEPGKTPDFNSDRAFGVNISDLRGLSPDTQQTLRNLNTKFFGPSEASFKGMRNTISGFFKNIEKNSAEMVARIADGMKEKIDDQFIPIGERIATVLAQPIDEASSAELSQAIVGLAKANVKAFALQATSLGNFGGRTVGDGPKTQRDKDIAEAEENRSAAGRYLDFVINKIKELQANSKAVREFNSNIDQTINALNALDVKVEKNELLGGNEQMFINLKNLAERLGVLNARLKEAKSFAEAGPIKIQMILDERQTKDLNSFIGLKDLEGTINAAEQLASKVGVTFNKRVFSKATLEAQQQFLDRLNEIAKIENSLITMQPGAINANGVGSPERLKQLQEAAIKTEKLRNEAVNGLGASLAQSGFDLESLQTMAEAAGITLSEGLLRNFGPQLANRARTLLSEAIEINAKMNVSGANIRELQERLAQIQFEINPRVEFLSTALGDITSLGAGVSSLQDLLHLPSGLITDLGAAGKRLFEMNQLMENMRKGEGFGAQLREAARQQADLVWRAMNQVRNSRPPTVDEITSRVTGVNKYAESNVLENAQLMPRQVRQALYDMGKQIEDIDFNKQDPNRKFSLFDVEAMEIQKEKILRSAEDIIRSYANSAVRLSTINEIYGDINLNADQWNRSTNAVRAPLYDNARDVIKIRNELSKLPEHEEERRAKLVEQLRVLEKQGKVLAKNAAIPTSSFGALQTLGSFTGVSIPEDAVKLPNNIQQSFTDQLKNLDDLKTRFNEGVANNTLDGREKVIAYNMIQKIARDLGIALEEQSKIALEDTDIYKSGQEMAGDMRDALKTGISDLLKGKSDKPFFIGLLDKFTDNILDSFVNGLVDSLTGAKDPNNAFNKIFGGLFSGSGFLGAKMGGDPKGGEFLTNTWENLRATVQAGSNAEVTMLGTLGQVLHGDFSSVGALLMNGFNALIAAIFGASANSALASASGGSGWGGVFSAIVGAFTGINIPAGSTNGMAGQRTGVGNMQGLDKDLEINGFFANGGIIPGNLGEPSLVVAHGKEVVLNTAQQKALLEGGVNGKQQVFNIHINGDISRQTRAEVVKMLPEIATGVNSVNHESGYMRR